MTLALSLRLRPWDETDYGITRELEVVDRPKFIPSKGIAGSATQITFDGESSLMIDGDLVVMQKGSCDDAHLVVTSLFNLKRTEIHNQTFSTDIRQVKGTNLFICLATKEAGGFSADDYTTLPEQFVQVAPPDFFPYRTYTGAAQVMEVGVPSVGDEVTCFTPNSNLIGE